MIAWAGWSILVAGLLSLAALGAERALALYGRPRRWAWAAAMAGTLAAPLALVLLSPAPRTPATVAVVAPALPIEAPVGRVPAAVPSIGVVERLEAGFPVAWAVGSLALLALLGVAAARLERARRRWPVAEMSGVPVMETDDLGPAVIGFLRPRIAVPGWVRRMDARLQELVVRHEREHQRAGDPRLLVAGLVARALLPWCLPLWWQFRRLRLAIELDCDRRVLAAGASLADYGELLLEVGRRSAARPLPAVGIFERRSHLEHRLRALAPGRPAHRRAAALALVGLAGAAVGAGAVVPRPVPPVNWSTGAAPDTTGTVRGPVLAPTEARDARSGEEDPSRIEVERVESLERGDASTAPLPAIAPADTPRFRRTAFDTPPRCVENCSADDILAAYRDADAPERCDAVVGIRIDSGGVVTATDRLDSTEGCYEPAATWARSTRWEPARAAGAPVDAWIAQPVRVYRDPPRTGGDPHVEAATDPDDLARTELRRAMVAQEMYRAEHGGYADAIQLDLALPATVTIEVRGGGAGYVMVARHDDGTTAYCANSGKGVVEGTDC